MIRIKDKKILEKHNFHITIVGRVSQNKRQFEAVKAAAILVKRGIDNFTLNVVGVIPTVRDNGYINNIKEFIASNKLRNVKLIPFSKTFREIQENTDIGLMCSDHEAMGRVTIESMLAGNLTIGADAGATPELIQHGETGYLYKCGDPEDLADKIFYAIQNKEMSCEVALSGQKYAMENFDYRVYGNMIYAIYINIHNQK